MKNEFIGFYKPTRKEINNAWSKGIFAFDTSTLLNLYRYSEQTRNDFISVLKTIQPRLFIPYQVAYEYQSNRISVINGLEDSYKILFEILRDNYDKKIDPQIKKFKKHPSILINKISLLYKEFLKNVSNELDKQKKNHPTFKINDTIFDELTKLFKDAIGPKFTIYELQKIYTEGKLRYEEKIPPGYRDLGDKNKNTKRHIYGDLIIWKELIKYTSNEKRRIIFVTDDIKDDWWRKEKGKTIGPREELIIEYYDLTGIRILIYNSNNFLKYAKEKRLVPKLKDKTINEVKSIKIYDEKFQARLNESLLEQQRRIDDLIKRFPNININPLSELVNRGFRLEQKRFDDLIKQFPNIAQDVFNGVNDSEKKTDLSKTPIDKKKSKGNEGK